uniref:N-acetylmuramoyl-L-alanine amidase n=1 Tax=Macrostomum lignano TaxID=282301 RepID=A0A1I8JQ70_9PLAT
MDKAVQRQRHARAEAISRSARAGYNSQSARIHSHFEDPKQPAGPVGATAAVDTGAAILEYHYTPEC